jgi:hypothetical protein
MSRQAQVTNPCAKPKSVDASGFWQKHESPKTVQLAMLAKTRKTLWNGQEKPKI